jgi:hypothetical protein
MHVHYIFSMSMCWSYYVFFFLKKMLSWSRQYISRLLDAPITRQVLWFSFEFFNLFHLDFMKWFIDALQEIYYTDLADA